MDVAKIVFWCVTVLLVIGSSFGMGIYSTVNQNGVFIAVQDGARAVDAALKAVEETPILVPTPFLQPTRRPGAGVTVNRRANDGALIFVAGFFEGDNQMRLMRRDGSVVRRWPVRFSELFPQPDHMRRPPATDWNVDTHGALALPDGSVLFNFEYGGLAKLDRCGDVAWTLGYRTHHSIEPASGGGFWVPGRRYVASGGGRLAPFRAPYHEDMILRVSAEGEVVTEISVSELMYEAGLEPLLTANGHWYLTEAAWNEELVHLNKIAELDSGIADAFPGFEAGDLALSLRDYNLLMIVEPGTWRVKWHQVGPWIRQHDPEFNADGTITVFNNNAYANHKVSPGDPAASYPSSILRIDPVSGDTDVVFGDRPGQEMLTVLRGKHEVLPGGGFLITEAEGGRLLETNAAGEIVWEYINRYDAENVAELSEARLYSPDYFTVDDWSCGLARN